jgi:CHAD domain-containing protein
VTEAAAELVLTGPETTGLPRGVSGAGSGLVVADGGRSPAGRLTLRRTWLDTFDWRLYRAGLTLEQVTSRGDSRLRLTGRDGNLVAEERGGPAGGLRWPARLEALPAGPLRDSLSKIVGVRALLRVAQATSRISQHRVLNGDEKTVALVSTDRFSVSHPAAVTLPPRVTIQPVRGYGAEARRFAGHLVTLPGVTASSQPVLEAALAAAGQRPGGYSGKLSVQLSPQMPGGAAMVAIFGALWDIVQANLGGTLRDTDPEFLHDLRIAVRRTRTALKLARGVITETERAAFAAEFRWLGDLSTPARDLDVYLLGYPAMAGSLTAASPADLAPFGDYLRGRRAGAQRELARGLRSRRFERLAESWRQAVAETSAGAPARPTAAELAARLIRRAHRRVLARATAAQPSAPAEALHDLRKRCKELRYALEMFASLADPRLHRQAVRDLKGLQDCLGEFQDAHVQQRELRRSAEQMIEQRRAQAGTLFAMGEIAAELAARQRKARETLAGAFAEFASPAGTSRIRELAGTLSR